jgi:hypothetical protein
MVSQLLGSVIGDLSVPRSIILPPKYLALALLPGTDIATELSIH